MRTVCAATGAPNARMRARARFASAFVLAVSLAAPSPSRVAAQQLKPRFSIDDVVSYNFPYDLVAARKADRIAWIEFERGMRNVYTAAAPDFEPVRLTSFTEDDGVDLSDLQISDDGSIVAFIRGHTRNREGWVANPSSDPRGAERAVWAVSTSGGKPWRVVQADAFQLSPDGKWVAYVRDGQIHRAPVNPGLAASQDLDATPPLFRAYGINGSPTWSPDGRRIAFVSDRGDHSFIGVYDLDNPRIVYLAPSVDRDANPVWSPDGKRIAFQRRPGLSFGEMAARQRQGGGFGGPQRRAADDALPGMFEARFRGGHTLELWVADAETGEGRRAWHNQPGDTAFTSLAGLRWAGEHLIFPAEPGNWRHWYSISLKDPKPEPIELTPGEGEVEFVGLSADGRYLYYAANIGDIDRRHIWRVETSGGRPRQLTKGDGIETYPAPLASGKFVAVLHSTAKRPLSVALVPADGGEPRVITKLPETFPLAQQVIPTNVTLTAEDGVRFNNQLFLPPDLRPGQKRPALIFIHGGPRRQMLLGYHYMYFYHMAYAINQYFANKGYVVLSVNYRSGIGYGKQFRMAPNVGRNGMEEYRDILAAGKYLASRPDVDPTRIGVWGLSYGGILTAQALARNSDLFAAGVDIAGVHMWGDPADTASVMYKSSSAPLVANWRSPVLLVHGDDDRNVSFSQTVGLVQLLRAHDVPFELIVFPDEVHDFLIHERWMKTFKAADDFFDRTLIRKEPVRDLTTAAGGGR
ncbi:MAG: prolyl oligopeptidase family serine peptidase [bacterium]|jgi:dipeptidyl-peptidase-4